MGMDNYIFSHERKALLADVDYSDPKHREYNLEVIKQFHDQFDMQVLYVAEMIVGQYHLLDVMKEVKQLKALKATEGAVPQQSIDEMEVKLRNLHYLLLSGKTNTRISGKR